MPPKAKRHRWRRTAWSDGTGRRRDPTNETPEPALRTLSTEVEATPRRVRGSSTEHAGTRAGTAATPENPRHKTTSEENKKFDPGGKGEKAPPWNAAIVLFFFSWGGRWAWGTCCLCFVLFFCLSVCLPCFFFLLSGDHFLAG